MSLHIYIAHTGEHFLADPVAFASYVSISLFDDTYYLFIYARMNYPNFS
jgi:hypothetical protein